jgi:hypothetical protein
VAIDSTQNTKRTALITVIARTLAADHRLIGRVLLQVRR